MYKYKKEVKESWVWNYLTVFTRFWGIVTATVMCGVGVDILLHHQMIGVCVILGSLSVLFLEVTWAITHVLKATFEKESKVFNVWNLVLYIEGWLKSVIYFTIAIFLLFKQHGLLLPFVSAIMLFFLGFFHLILSFRSKSNKKKECLLQNQDERNEENIFEVLDNSFKSKEEVVFDEPGGNVLEI